MIIWQIPHTAIPYSCSAVVLARFNEPQAPGAYYIDPTPQFLLPVKPTAIYLIDRFAFSTSLPEDYWCSSLRAPIPELALWSSQKGNCYPKPYQLGVYRPDASGPGWYMSIAGNDTLNAKVSGTFLQTDDTIGISTVKIVLSFDIYEVTDTNFQIAHREGLSPNVGQQNRGN